MKIFNFKRKNIFFGPHLLGLLLILAGLFALISPLFFNSPSSTEKVLTVGLGAIFLGMIIVFTYGGTIIDFSKNRFKEYFSVCGYKIGDWINLPLVIRVKVISKTYFSTNTPNGIHPTLSGFVTDYKILLYSNSSKPIFSFTYSKRQRALKEAKNLASILNAELIINIPENE